MIQGVFNYEQPRILISEGRFQIFDFKKNSKILHDR
jgi:hypothetical protein